MDCLLTLFFTSNTALGGAPLDGTVTLGHLSGGGGSHWAGGTLRYLDAGGGVPILPFTPPSLTHSQSQLLAAASYRLPPG